MKVKTKTLYSKADGYTKEERERYEYLDKAGCKIEDAIESNGPYSHNLVSAVLRSVAGRYGKTDANNLIHEYNLKSVYGIRPIK